MEKRHFGRTDMHVSLLGFGGAEIGFEGAAQATVSDLLTTALETGVNVIDTAECYPGSEELIGHAIRGHRRSFFLFTKCGHPEGLPKENWRPESLLESVQRSLRRLQVNYVDLVHLHSCSLAELQKGDVIAALEKAKDQGLTRYIGYSGDGTAARYAVDCGRFDSLQTSVSIADQEAIDLTLPPAVQRKMGVIAKRPIANAAWRHDKLPANTYHQPYWKRLSELDYDFLKGPDAAAIALRFTLSQSVHTAIVGTKNPKRCKENAELIKSGPLPPDQIHAIRRRWQEVAKKDWTGQV
jgi:aryl-alcohol dehydrogenase-like predicted oxidoreductase